MTGIVEALAKVVVVLWDRAEWWCEYEPVWPAPRRDDEHGDCPCPTCAAGRLIKDIRERGT